MSTFYLFTWPHYESGGVEEDCLGKFETLGAAMSAEGLQEQGRVIEIRDGVLLVVAEYDNWPPVWKQCQRELGDMERIE